MINNSYNSYSINDNNSYSINSSNSYSINSSNDYSAAARDVCAVETAASALVVRIARRRPRTSRNVACSPRPTPSDDASSVIPQCVIQHRSEGQCRQGLYRGGRNQIWSCASELAV